MRLGKARSIISFIMAVSLLTGCNAVKNETESQTVHLTLKVPTLTHHTPAEPDISSASEFLEKMAAAYTKEHENVKIDIVVFALTEEDAYITDCFDTENAVDILYEGYFNMAGYVHTGRVVPLDDIISDAIKEDISDFMWAMSQTNGKTYMMPFTSDQNIIAYNKDLFRQAGLESYVSDEPVIQNWTLEEWEEILDTLAANRPAGSFPMMMYAKNEQGDTHIMTLLRSQGSTFFDQDGLFHLDTPEGIAGLQWLSEGVDKGWFPPYSENLEIVDCSKLFANGQLGIYMTNNALLHYDGIDMGYVNFPSDGGGGYATSFLIGFQVFDNGDNAKVAAAKDFLKYIYETEQWLDYSAGGIPASNKTEEKYKSEISMLDEFFANNENVVDFTMNNPNWRGVRAVFWTSIHDLLNGELTAKEAAQKIDQECNEKIEEGRKTSRLHE